MIKKPFFGWGRPRLRYPVIRGVQNEPVREIPLPGKATLLIDYPFRKINESFLKRGDRLRTGQRVKLSDDGREYFISSVTGTVGNLSVYTGYMGRSYSSIFIEDITEDQWDEEFKNSSDKISADRCLGFLRRIPGIVDFERLISPSVPLDTIVIKGIDEDLLVKTNQLVVMNDQDALSRGVGYLKDLTGVSRIIIIAPPELASVSAGSGAEVRPIKPFYPHGLDQIIMKMILNRTMPVGSASEDIGVAFINAEAVAALGTAIHSNQMPVNKSFTLIGKDGRSMNIRARIGTQFKDIFEHLNIRAEHGDRLILGGPMKGRSIYMEDMPVNYNTDAIIVQHSGQIVESGDIPCINCGECVRACPADIPVNMLIRLLENGLYNEASQEYDLMSCIKCGLCSYVCTARIPVFHYIMLGLTELDKQRSREGSNA